MAKVNPFSPNFGKLPNVFLGQETLMRSLLDAAKNSNSPWRTTLLTGARGTGKTAAMEEMRVKFPKNTVFVNTAADDKLLDTMLDALELATISELDVHLSVDLGVLKLGTQDKELANFYGKATPIIQQLSVGNRLIVFTIDEVQTNVETLIEFAKAYQLWVRDGYNVMLVMAGLSFYMDDLLNNKAVTFLRRSQQYKLRPVSTPKEIAATYITELQKNGITLSQQHALYLAKETRGYPYLIQLFGAKLWDLGVKVIDDEAISAVENYAKDMMFSNVHRLILHELSAQRLLYAQTMAKLMGDGDIATTSVIAESMGKTTSALSQAREALLNFGLIASPKRGEVMFTIPYTKEFFLGELSELHDDYDYTMWL
ncbi:ATP-binding protein [Weissella cibaria]|uniref:ATP-binding protein n=1 Tax=Weissella cibaria TaxID=137591 RepID=UPI001CC79DA9|nr:ATP-binding protein [Weissella cibaria]MBZ6069388.1 ATP-binding protein [Weissella cibaria]